MIQRVDIVLDLETRDSLPTARLRSIGFARMTPRQDISLKLNSTHYRLKGATAFFAQLRFFVQQGIRQYSGIPKHDKNVSSARRKVEAAIIRAEKAHAATEKALHEYREALYTSMDRQRRLERRKSDGAAPKGSV